MKVLHVVGDSVFGGGSRIVAALAERARSEGHQVSVLTTCPALGDDLIRRGVEVVPLDCIWRPIRPLRDLRGLIRLTAFLRKGRYDLVHTHTSKAGFVGRLAARLAGVRIVVHTLHGFAFHDRSPAVARIAYTALERLAARWCDRIVTVSVYLREQALAWRIGRPPQVVAIPNGIGANAVASSAQRDAARAALELAADTFVLLVVGRLAPQKGLEDLIDALPRVIARATCPVRLLVAGVGPLDARLRQRVEVVGCARAVTFCGFRSDVESLLAAADLVVLPSVREGLSIALLEAMAAGLPIVATSIPANREGSRDGEAALLVPCGAPGALAEAILSLLADPAARRELGQRARAAYEAHYTQERMLLGYMDLYRELAGA
jgi:glycosyltransferase involved in cell wall biosynthesis